jgi:hypothetical protein
MNGKTTAKTYMKLESNVRSTLVSDSTKVWFNTLLENRKTPNSNQ